GRLASREWTDLPTSIRREQDIVMSYDPSTTAILLVDPYNDFLSDGGKLWARGTPPPPSAMRRCTPPCDAALEVGASDFDADTAERYGWINRAIPDAELDAFVANFVDRVLSFDRQALCAAKSIINHTGLPDPTALQSTQDIFFQSFTWEGAKVRLPKLRERGIGQAGDFELDLGRHVGSL
ncbi:MAG: hypothetical protein WAV18_26140, partial [Roseiarcus sp.]